MILHVYSFYATLTLDPDEPLRKHELELAVRKIATETTAVWNVEIELPVPVMSHDAATLSDLGFVVAGTVNTGSQTLMKWRLALRRSGDGGGDQRLLDPNLAVPGPVLAPTNEEQRAIRELFAKKGWALPEPVKPPMSTNTFIEQSSPKIEPKPEPKQEPTPLERARFAELEKIEDEQRRLLEAHMIMDRIQPKPEATE